MTQNCIHRRKRPGFTNKMSYGCVTLVQKRTDKNVSTLGWGMGGRREGEAQREGKDGVESLKVVGSLVLFVTHFKESYFCVDV